MSLTRASRHRRVLRLAHRLASIGLLLLIAMLVPASVLAQAGLVVEYYHLDALGSVRAVSNQQGQVISRHEFLPFGEEWTPGTPQREKKLFTGKERDPETSFDYFGARYYDSRVGRFTTIDPLQTTAENLVDPQKWNRYTYAKNNPLRFVDPDGRNPALPFIWVIPGPQQPILIVGSILVTSAVVLSTEEGRRGVAEAASGLWNLVTKASDVLSSVFQNEERKGGGKTGRKQNEDAGASAQNNYEKAKRDLDSARRVPNKTGEQAQKVRELEAQVKHWQKKAHDLSEEHARKAQK